MALAELVQELAAKQGIDADVELIENPRGNETLVDSFAVDTSKAAETLGWQAEHTVEESVRELLS
jgi:UDP-glucose 4-epimerase